MKKMFNRGVPEGSAADVVTTARPEAVDLAVSPATSPSPTDDTPLSISVAPAVFAEDAGQAAVKVEAAVRAGAHVIVAGWSVGRLKIEVSIDGAAPASLRRFNRADVARHFDRSADEQHGWVCVLACVAGDTVSVAVTHGGSIKVEEVLGLQAAADLDAAQLALLGPAAGVATFAFQPFSADWRSALQRVESTSAAPRHVHGCLESALAIPGIGRVVVVGWALSAPGSAVWIEDGEGGIHSLDDAPRVPRDDLQSRFGAQFGAAALMGGFITSIEGAQAGGALRLKALTADGLHLLSEIVAAQAPAAPLPVARWLSGIPLVDGSIDGSFDVVAGPLLQELIARDRGQWADLPVTGRTLGAPPASPEVSIVVPLYARTDFVESQMVEWARDPWVREKAELIYVVDDPALVEPFRQQAEELHRLYRVPFRWVWGHANRGFSGANNLGALQAHAPRLLFLNSDAFPQEPGWLARLVDILDANPDIGVVGPRLTFAEGGIQHAGMRFERLEQYGVWINKHPGVGLDPKLDPVRAPTRVPAVTGACMLVRTADFNAVGDWDTGYLIGDFEDSDLCLKLHERGLGSLYVPDVQLTHLERQSMNALGGDAFRIWVTLWNAVRHQRRWHTLIERFAEAAQ